jgi:hypothetical protein
MTMLAPLLALATLVPAAAGDLRIEIDPTSVEIGDLVTVELEARLAPGQRAVFPSWGATWGEAEIRARGEVEHLPSDEGELVRQRLQIAFFRPGHFELPAPDVRVLDGGKERRLETAAPLSVSVLSVLPTTGEAPEPRPPQPPRALKAWTPSFLWTTGLLALACAAALVVLAQRRRSNLAERVVPVDPLAELRAALSALDAEAMAPAPAFAILSMALRQFIARTLSFPAVESTTTEIRAHLRHRELGADLATRIDRLLRQCDLVKFARQQFGGAGVESARAEVESVALALLAATAPRGEPEQESAA